MTAQRTLGRLVLPLGMVLALLAVEGCGVDRSPPSTDPAAVASNGDALRLPSWRKISGSPFAYSGVPDGINDRENSYAWSMEIFDGYLWVGTNRNVFAYMFMQPGMPTPPPEVPPMTDMRARIYRMSLASGVWEEFYTPFDVTMGQGPVRLGGDGGYRMAKTYVTPGGDAFLFFGGLATGSPGRPSAASLIAIDRAASRDGSAGMVRPFSSVAERLISIRAIAEHDGKLFWATEDMKDPKTSLGPAVFYSADPVADFRAGVPFGKIPVPPAWLLRGGAEVLDMVSYRGALYVFLTPFAADGFWCGKLKKSGETYQWELIVGDPALGAKYPPGMGRALNGGAVPVVFKDKVYVGTMDAVAFKLMNGVGTPAPGDATMGGLNGMQIFRFDRRDRWERVMPPGWVRNPRFVDLLNGFMNPANKYIWRFGVQGDVLYAGTFDIGTGTRILSEAMGVPPPELKNPPGFDLYWTRDGDLWLPVSLDGFHDKYNYGTRSFVTDPESGDLFMGTANPFYGCQVWKKPAAP